MRCLSVTVLLLAAFSLEGKAANAASLSDEELAERLELFGPGFVVEQISAPVIENPEDWINRQPGEYVYRFVVGSDNGDELHTEYHIPNSENPETAWRRQIGDSLIESFEITDDRDILIVEEVDHDHGFRIEIHPGVHLPRGIEPGAEWEIDAKLRAYRTEDGSFAHEGELTALHSYEGAYRVRTPAGQFDAVLIREDFKLRLGPLKADDDRLLFFSRGIGLIAEEEGIRASALFVVNIHELSAKVLVEHPSMAAPATKAADE